MSEINTLIREILEKLTSSGTDIVECLKKTRLIATHFNDTIMIEWIDREMFGYNDRAEIPKYRTILTSIYNDVYETHPTGYGQIANIHSRDLSKPFEFPFPFGIQQIQKYANKLETRLTFRFVKMDKPVQLIFSADGFQRIIYHINLKLMDYIVEKSKNISQRPFESPLMNIFNRFHLIARRMLERYDQRSTLQINDEYDVQDLLNSVLAIEFDSIQKEEYGPQYAGKRPRLDFFLKSEGIAIEVKFVKDISSIAKIREGIILDKEYYSKKEDLKDLFFFIYDPKSAIIDRTLFIKDLEANQPKSLRSLKIIIKPDI